MVKDSVGPGTYQVYAYVNPGESGHVYLKVFEGGGNDPISDEDFSAFYKDETTEYTGWSGEANEQFFYNTSISFPKEGLVSHYAVRLEMWFVPESGGPEHKLFEKYFNITGMPTTW